MRTSALGAGVFFGLPLFSGRAGARFNKDLRFAFYTDIHARTEWGTPEAMAKAAEAINAVGADFVICGGDMVTDGFQSSVESMGPRWDAYMKMHRAIKGELYPVLGNHDLCGAIPEDGTEPEENPRKTYLTRMGLERTWYSFDAAGHHFVVLDSVEVTGGDLKFRGFINEEQQEWLKEDLESVSSVTPIILSTHMPLLTSFVQATRGGTYSAKENRVVVNNLEIFELFGNHNLLLVLQGHSHVDELIQWRNTTFITGGAVCAKWWRGPWFDTEEGFGVVTIKNGNVFWEYVDYGWEARRPTGK